MLPFVFLNHMSFNTLFLVFGKYGLNLFYQDFEVWSGFMFPGCKRSLNVSMNIALI